ncbi:hypothetical protein [Streptomyces griseorubiginosus]|uniref:hypothetical protein n=1 Tax=Streptomyces griseorubiginosus TaxID=67304 RepID=UPI003655FF14
MIGREPDMYGPFGGSSGNYHQTLHNIAEGWIDVGASSARLTQDIRVARFHHPR